MRMSRGDVGGRMRCEIRDLRRRCLADAAPRGTRGAEIANAAKIDESSDAGGDFNRLLLDEKRKRLAELRRKGEFVILANPPKFAARIGPRLFVIDSRP